jgi:hypothetical protein
VGHRLLHKLEEPRHQRNAVRQYRTAHEAPAKHDRRTTVVDNHALVAAIRRLPSRLGLVVVTGSVNLNLNARDSSACTSNTFITTVLVMPVVRVSESNMIIRCSGNARTHNQRDDGDNLSQGQQRWTTSNERRDVPELLELEALDSESDSDAADSEALAAAGGLAGS